MSFILFGSGRITRIFAVFQREGIISDKVEYVHDILFFADLISHEMTFACENVSYQNILQDIFVVESQITDIIFYTRY